MLILVLIFISNIADIAIMFFIAFIITCAIDPVVSFLQKYMPRVLAVSIVLLMILIGILLIFIPLLTLTIEQSIIFVKNVPQYIQNLQNFLNKMGAKITVEGKSKTNKTMLTGRTDSNKVVVLEGSDDLIGQVVLLKIVSEHMWYLKGKII